MATVMTVSAAKPVFEVATIKPALLSNPMEAMHGSAPIGMKIDGMRVDIANLTVLDLVRIAYQVKPYQIVAPEGMKDAQRWDIQAKLPEGTTAEQVPAMLQSLLVERFRVAVHKEMKEHGVYALLVAKGGPKLQESDLADTSVGHGPAAGMQINRGAMNIFLTSEELGPVKVSAGSAALGIRLEAQKATMAALAELLSRVVDRPVIDMTGLKGKYEVALDLTADDIRTMATTSGFAVAGMGPGNTEGGEMHAGVAGTGSTVLQSVQQLGLRLEARKAPMETIVLDHAEKKPTEN
jgi:uncharacterized protein (TIGR03435 family)